MSDRFGRIKKEIAPEMAKLGALHIEEAVAEYPYQLLTHKAHVVMLEEQNILKKDEAAAILRALSTIEKEAERNPRLTSYMETEAFVIKQAGTVGGKMHIGRSRNDLAATQSRMFVREQTNQVIENVLELQKSLLKTAEKNLNTVMPGYTHWQQAQPVTFAHYLVAHMDACERCLSRLEEAYKMTNKNPLGAAALAGTGWPINRQRTSELLGFDGLLENAYDAVAARDYIFDLASAIAILMSNVSRLAEDLEIWSSNEFSMVDLDEAYAGTSSIMPQKKNPSSLEMTKAHAAEAIGHLTSIISSMKGIAYTNVGDRVTSIKRMVDDAVGTLRMMGGVVSTLNVNKELMLERARKGFSTMTDLADILVREKGLSFREAHEIIANAVVKVVAEGKGADEITTGIIDEAALEVVGKPVNLSQEDLCAAIDPMENVKRRRIIGGPAPEEVKRMIDNRWIRVEEAEARHKLRVTKLRKAYEKLEKAEDKILL